MEVTDPLTGSELMLSHVKKKLASGIKVQQTERFGAMTAAASGLREGYGPTPRTSEPVEIPLPETIKGAIASAKG